LKVNKYTYVLNVVAVESLYSAMCDCQALHPDENDSLGYFITLIHNILHDLTISRSNDEQSYLTFRSLRYSYTNRRFAVLRILK